MQTSPAPEQSLILIPAAFLLAFRPHAKWLCVACAFMLDEFVYLLATQASDADYISRLALVGAFVLISATSILLLSVYRTRGY